MNHDPEKHHRRSIRLKGYDYSGSGAYFVTICTQNRACLFGAVRNGAVELNQVGEIAESAWNELPARFLSVGLDAFVVMPNHVHGIIIVGAQFIAPPNVLGKSKQAVMNPAPTLGEMVRVYKAVSTRFIRQTGIQNFAWQRNYYEHVIRSEEALHRIRQYIVDNPARWEFDRENPNATAPEPEPAWDP
jgi:REP element-mobilizing transposase RayT